METKLVFTNRKIYWVVIAVLVCTLVAHALLLNRRFELLTFLHILWIGSILYLIYIKSSKALLNIKLWIIVALIASPLLRMAGRFLNEMLQESAALQIEFYLYRLLSVLVGLIILNWVRNTAKLENRISN
jgi:hypothetical protein